MTTATTFSRQNDAGSRVSNVQNCENLLLVVVLVSEYMNSSGTQSKILFVTHSVRELRSEVSLYHLEVVLDSWVAIKHMHRVNFKDLG